MLAHTGSKPYKCLFCDYRSSRKDSVKRHARLRHYQGVPGVDGSTKVGNVVVQVIEEERMLPYSL